MGRPNCMGVGAGGWVPCIGPRVGWCGVLMCQGCHAIRSLGNVCQRVTSPGWHAASLPAPLVGRCQGLAQVVYKACPWHHALALTCQGGLRPPRTPPTHPSEMLVVQALGAYAFFDMTL